MLIYNRLRARVMATYIKRRSSSKPPCSCKLYWLGNKPSSMPLKNTASNSKPFAACMVINCRAASLPWAWFSPDSNEALLKNAKMGNNGLSVKWVGKASNVLSIGLNTMAALTNSAKLSKRSWWSPF